LPGLVRSTLELMADKAGGELSGLPRFPVKFVAVSAIQNNNEVCPYKAPDDYEEKPLHA
jgi:hypothetical protein